MPADQDKHTSCWMTSETRSVGKGVTQTKTALMVEVGDEDFRRRIPLDSEDFEELRTQGVRVVIV